MAVVCPHCGQSFKGDRINARHLAKCNPSPPPPPCLCGHESTSLTQMKRHRRTCEVWKTRDRKALANERRRQTSLERYGVGDARRTPEANTKREATNEDRYGASNPFCREATTFEQVQASLEGKRPVLKGSNNPFSRPEVKEKIQEHWQQEHGVSNPQQVPGIRAATRQTNLERYGVEETLASPEIREAIRETCEERYGGPAPSCSPEVLAKQQETNLERYGVPWTAMNPEVRRKQHEAMEERWGTHFFASGEGRRAIREAMLEKHGVENPAQMEDFWEKAVATFLEKYGVEHPLQLPEMRAKRVETCRDRFGVDSPMQHPEVQRQVRKTCQERYDADSFVGSEAYREWSMKTYGAPHPMQNREYARQHLEKMSRPGPNMLERRVASLHPRLMFTGDGAFWRWLPKLRHHKNPDFIIPGPDQGHPYREVTQVIEAFGDYWHSRIFTGKAPFAHEQELIDAYEEVGIACLVLWESEVKKDIEAVRERLALFLGT